MLDSLRREGIYLWYYFSVQLEQVFRYWVLGMVIGSAISVFAKDRLHGLFRAMAGRPWESLASYRRVFWGSLLPSACTVPSLLRRPSPGRECVMTGWQLL